MCNSMYNVLGVQHKDVQGLQQWDVHTMYTLEESVTDALTLTLNLHMSFNCLTPFSESIGLVVHQIALRMEGRGLDSPYGRPQRCTSLSTAMVACPVEVEDRSCYTTIRV